MVFAMVLSIAVPLLITASPVSATCSATAPSSPVTVKQGDVFLLRGSITFDNPAEIGYFSWGPVYWYNYGNENENFCLENTPSVYWTSPPAGLNVGDPVDNIAISDYAIPDGWQVDIGDDGSGIAANGTFCVDIWLRAASGGGTLHAPGSQDISFAMGQITLNEGGIVTVPAGPITVNVTALSRGVDVSISPSLKQGWTGDNLVYDVTVKNTGEISENFKLRLSELLGWPHGGIPDSETFSIGILAAADGQVMENRPDDNKNYSQYNMYVGWDNTYGNNAERSYIKFDLSSIPTGALITSAVENLMGRYGPSHPPGNIADNMWVEAWSVTGAGTYYSADNWTENDNVCWHRRPADGALDTLLDNVQWDGGAPQYTRWYWNVLPFVKSEFAGDKIATFCMTSLTEENPATRENNSGWFYTRNNTKAENRPYLNVSGYSLVTELAPSASWTGQIWVVVSGSGSPGTTDNLTVTAKTMDDAVSDSATCQAQATGAKVELRDENDNWVYGYSTIQSAIDAASAGFKITVRPGTYKESLYVNVENLTIRSMDGAGVTIINAGGAENGVKIVENGVTFKGFTVENDNYGIWLDQADNNTIENNICRDTPGDGIHLESSDKNTISNNTCENNSRGIYLNGSSNNTLNNNTCENNSRGIYLYDSSNTTIENNLIDNNGHGIYIDGAASFAVIRFNDITNNTTVDSGIHIASGVDATRIVVNYNNIVGNTAEGSYGVFNGGDNKLNARFNWWGKASGPGGVGPGAGDNVGENVDYTPWLLKPFENVIVSSTFKNVSAPSDNVKLEGVAEVSMDLKENGMVSTTVIKDFSGAFIPEGLLQTGFFVDISTVPENIAENIWITFHYTDADVAGIDESSLKLYCWSAADNSWRLCENITVDTVANTVTGWVNHLTPFGMFGVPLPPALPPAAGVNVSISPSSKSGTPGTELTYTVTVMNTGGGMDTFDLHISGGDGWSPGLSSNSLILTSGASGTSTLTVTVPSWVAAGFSTTITVTATSRADPSVSDSASCSATASAAPQAGPAAALPAPEILWPAIVAIAVAIVAIVLLLAYILGKL